jgi:hypothetical protein
MKKKLLIAVALFLVTSITWADPIRVEWDDGYGLWGGQIEFVGLNEGQQTVRMVRSTYEEAPIRTLSTVELRYIDEMLDYFWLEAGDTYYLTLSYWPRNRNPRLGPLVGYIIVVEITRSNGWASDTAYSYWAFYVAR